MRDLFKTSLCNLSTQSNSTNCTNFNPTRRPLGRVNIWDCWSKFSAQQINGSVRVKPSNATWMLYPTRSITTPTATAMSHRWRGKVRKQLVSRISRLLQSHLYPNSSKVRSSPIGPFQWAHHQQKEAKINAHHSSGPSHKSQNSSPHWMLSVGPTQKPPKQLVGGTHKEHKPKKGK